MLGSAMKSKGTKINADWLSSLSMEFTSYQLQNVVLGLI